MNTKGETIGRDLGGIQAESKDFTLQLKRMMEATRAHSQRNLAAILGIRPSGVTDAKRRSNVPKEWYLKLYSSHGLNPDWLMTGEGPMYLKEVAGAAKPVRFESGDGEAWSIVPVRSLCDPCGVELGQVPIPVEFNLPELLVTRMDGSRMEPTIRRGALLGIDRSDQTLRPGEIHALLGTRGELHLHRVYCDGSDSCLLLTCDNTREKLPLSMPNARDRAYGRVAWVMQAI